MPNWELKCKLKNGRQHNLRFIRVNSADAVWKIALVNVRNATSFDHRNGSSCRNCHWTTIILFGGGSMTRQMPQLQSPCVSPKAIPNKQSDSGLWICKFIKIHDSTGTSTISYNKKEKMGLKYFIKATNFGPGKRNYKNFYISFINMMKNMNFAKVFNNRISELRLWWAMNKEICK